MGTSRRAVLGAGLLATGGAVLAGCSRGAASPEGDRSAVTATDSPVAAATVPFHGPHQAGIGTPPQAHAIFQAFDVDGAPPAPRLADAATPPRLDESTVRRLRAQIQGILRVWTDDAARLTSGRGGLADADVELAEGPARLTVTIGFGPRLFDLVGLTERRPRWLAPLPGFRIDELEDRWSGGDLLLQICGDDQLVVANAARVLRAGVRGSATPRWTQKGFRRAAGTTPEGATQRNLFGQLDGTVNPDPGGTAVFCGPDEEQAWMRGGSGLVLRRIAMDLPLWEAVDRPQRDLSLGREQGSGAPLGGTHEFDPVDLERTDATGLPVIPPESHVARAHARGPGEVFLRRPFNYLDDDGAAEPRAGLLFAAYAADYEAQFLPVQRRLAEVDLLNTWTTPIGSAVFALPPGVPEPGAGRSEILGAGLFA